MSRPVLLLVFLLVASSTSLGPNPHRIAGIVQKIAAFAVNTEGRLRGWKYEKHSRDLLKHDKALTFDFIIVGAGSAGSVLANRLSEVPEWRILLIEAGHQGSDIGDIPGLATALFYTNYNWNYYMEKMDDFGLGLINQSVAYIRGKGLGGSSLVNYMMHTRGNSKDYDRWANLGNPGWSYEDVLPYFIKSEDFVSDNKGDRGYHQRGGYLSVQYPPYRTESAHVFVRAAQELGLDIVDYNGQTQVGVSYIQGDLRRGLRCNTEKAFLKPARSRSNLKVITGARATKVLIDPGTKEAYGVEFHRNGKYYRATARREVVLSAGAFHSSQLLMLSGIGPRRQLERFGIDVIKDAPVGQKLYDHISFLGIFFTVNESITIDKVYAQFNPVNYLKIFAKGTGPLTVLAGAVEGLAYFNTGVDHDGPSASSDYPDMEVFFLSGSFHTDFGLFLKDNFRISDKVWNAVWEPYVGKSAYCILPLLVHPKSYGHVELRSKDPFDSPKLYGNYLSDPDGVDMKTLIAAIRTIQKMGRSAAFTKYGSQLVTRKIPGCEKHEFDTDDYWECAVRHVSVSIHHQVASCKMGPRNDTEAVVDADLKVYGVKKLRVADISVIPIPLTGHMNAPAVMVGEKASDIIKKAWDKPVL